MSNVYRKLIRTEVEIFIYSHKAYNKRIIVSIHIYRHIFSCTDHMLLVTCPFGLTALLTKELKRIGLRPFNSFPTWCWIQDDTWKDRIRINLQSRLANKVYHCIHTYTATDFEWLFQGILAIERKNHIWPQVPFRIIAQSKESMLHATRSIQSICQKAIATKLTWSKEGIRKTNTHYHPLDILIFIQNNTVHVLKNLSWDALYKRWRRITQWDAPIKEHLAAATILSASWPFAQPLRDPCCGSGTLLIEAAYIAKNIASWSKRSFAFQHFLAYPKELFLKIQNQLQQKIYSWSRTLLWTDNDPAMLEKAKRNAHEAWVEDLIHFCTHDLLDQENRLPSYLNNQLIQHQHKWATLVSNPPYDKRLQTNTVEDIHHKLAQYISQPWRHGAIISWYTHANKIFTPSSRKRKETRQGKEVCYIFSPKWKRL